MVQSFKTEGELQAAIGFVALGALQMDMTKHIYSEIKSRKVNPTSGTSAMLWVLPKSTQQVWIEIDWAYEVRGRQVGFDVGFHCILLADKIEDFYADEILDRYNGLSDAMKKAIKQLKN